MKSASVIMLQIQREQNQHDLLAHQDILNLDTHTKIKHMTLHFLKYTGKIAEICDVKDHKRLEAILVDVFIICLATANALNVNIGAFWDGHGNDIDELAKTFGSEIKIDDPCMFSLLTIAKIAGRMAKAIESTDHLENGNPRASLEQLILELTKEVFSIIGFLKISLESSIHSRWSAVESKSIFSLA